MAASKILSQVQSMSSSDATKASPSRRSRTHGFPEDQVGKRASVGQRWKFRRNLVIFIANQHGVSQRMLADVFDLPHSRIAAILKELRHKYGQPSQRLLD